MKEIKKYTTKLLILPVFVLVFFVSAYAQVNTGNGNLTVGDYWNSFLPPNNPNHSSAAAGAGPAMILFGSSVDKTWSNPKGQWPNAFPWTDKWTPWIGFFIYDPDTTVCPKTINGVANAACIANAIPAGGHTYSNYFTANFKKTQQGVTDPARTYQNTVQWVDPARRQHLMYEAGWVTNIGLDIKLRAHQFAAPNWNNFNDFIILEITMKNTGNVDINSDGTFEKTNHKITALSVCYDDGNYSPITTTDVSGTRGSYWGTNPARDCGYVGELDQNGSPWDINCDFGGCSTPLNETQAVPLRPTAGNYDMGIAPWSFKYYTDIWSGYSWIGSKKGGLPSDPSKSTINNADKTLMWGTPAIGTGAQRGWFATSGHDYGAWNGMATGAPGWSFRESIGAYYKSGGKAGADENAQNWNPNPNFFSSGVSEKLETWVPKKTSGFTDADRPNGDYKYKSLETPADPASAFYQITENGLEDLGKFYTPTNSSGKPAWGYMGTRGFVDYQNFDIATYSAVGPYGLDVNEEMTVTFLIGAGFRLEGLQKAIRAGRYAYENNFSIPTPPALPIVHIKTTTTPSIQVKWDNSAEQDPKFAGYKVWQSSQFKRYTYLDAGLRLSDKYEEQMTPGEDKTKYKKPINPRFDAFKVVEQSAYRGQYPGYYWGTYELLQTIPKSDLAKYVDPSPLSDTKYVYDDKLVGIGGSYWYYVSAYGEGTYNGPDGETTTRIETHSVNRNGASGLWQGTFPYAKNNASYPKTDAGKEQIGAVVNLYSPVASSNELVSGTKKIGVRPNPYKRAALQDNFLKTYDHKLLFYNLPSPCKITITDVAGHIIQIIDFATTDNSGGSVFWNMFSKDGEEVSSGLYIYYAEYSGGTQTGKFSILR